MFFGISHVDVQVTDLERARAFYCDCLGFSVAKSGTGFTDVDVGTFALRLTRVKSIERQVSLRVQVREVDEALAAVVAAGGTSLYDKTRTDDLEWMAAALDPDGHRIILWRELTEDEYDFVPELPKELTWNADAEDLLKSLLKHVPALFRALARRKTTRVIEELAAETRRVTKEHVVRGYILSSAKITRGRLIEPLKAHGYDPADYQAEFDEEPG